MREDVIYSRAKILRMYNNYVGAARGTREGQAELRQTEREREEGRERGEREREREGGREGERRRLASSGEVSEIYYKTRRNKSRLSRDSAANTSLIKSRKLYYNGVLINRKIVLSYRRGYRRRVSLSDAEF